MNSETAKLIEQLAAKLGTTTEYLWGVLLAQAKIYALTTTIEIILVVLAGVALYRVHLRLSNDDNTHSYYENEAYAWIMGMVTFIWACLVLMAFFSINNVFNALFNPEFWALDYILCRLK